MLDDITTYFSNDSRLADYEDKVSVGHGRIEILESGSHRN